MSRRRGPASRVLRAAVWAAEARDGLPDLSFCGSAKVEPGVLEAAPDWFAVALDPLGSASSSYADEVMREGPDGIRVRLHPEVMASEEPGAEWALDALRRGRVEQEPGEDDRLSGWQQSALAIARGAHARLVRHIRKQG